MFALWALLFFCSGAAALIAQIVWSRQLALVVGASAPATALVLALFMLGLALGARLAAGRATRVASPLRAFAWCEAGGGLWALLSIFLTRLLPPLYAAAGGGWVVRIALCGLLVLPATLLWGAGLPLITQHWARSRGEAPATAGLLYGINTLGAAVGAFAAGFALLPSFGFRAALFAAALLDLGAGLAALALAGRERAAPADLPPAAARLPVRQAAALLLLGAASFALEVALTRALVLHWSSGVYAFSALLATTLLATGAGGWLGGWLAARFGADRTLGISLGLAALTPAWILFQAARIDDLTLALSHRLPGATPAGNGLLLVLAGLPLLLPAAALSGMAIPALTRRSDRAGSDLGRIYFWNGLGNVAGAALAGFVLIPRLGAQGVLFLCGWVWLSAALLLLPPGRAPRRWAAAALVGACLLLVRRAYPPHALLTGSPIFHTAQLAPVALYEGVNGTALLSVASENLPDAPADRFLSLQVNGVDVAGTQPDNYSIQKLQAHLPLLFHPDPRRVLHIGVGSGGTAYSASLHPVEEITIAEIAPEVKSLAERWFPITNHGVFADPRVRFVYDDGRNVLLASRRTWDVILSDSVHPRIAGNGSLYTVEYFRLLRSRLAPGGVASMWLPAYTVRPQDFRAIVSAYCAAFRPGGGDVAIFYNRATLNQFTVVVARRDAPLEFDLARVGRALDREPLRADLAGIGRARPESLLADYVTGGDALCGWAAGQPPMSDDRLEAEYGSGVWALDRDVTWWSTFDRLMAIRESPLPRVRGGEAAFAGRFAPEWDAAVENLAGQRMMGRANAYALRGDEPLSRQANLAARRHFERAWALAPESREPVNLTRAYAFPRRLPPELDNLNPPR